MSCAVVPLSQFVATPLILVFGLAILVSFIRDPLRVGYGLYIVGFTATLLGAAYAGAAYTCQ